MYLYLNYGIEHWGCASKMLLMFITVLQKTCNHIIAHVPHNAHVAPLANYYNLLMLDDIYVFCILSFMNKIFNNLSIDVCQNLFKKTSEVYVRNTRSSNYKSVVFTVRTYVGKYFVSHNGVKLWNNL